MPDLSQLSESAKEELITDLWTRLQTALVEIAELAAKVTEQQDRAGQGTPTASSA